MLLDGRRLEARSTWETRLWRMGWRTESPTALPLRAMCVTCRVQIGRVCSASLQCGCVASSLIVNWPQCCCPVSDG